MNAYKKNNAQQRLAITLIVLMLNQVGFPALALALTAGPTQPELQSFEPVGTTEMVDLFSGDFTYNIPLFELPGPNGGYPVNLFYNSVTSPETEASTVGLGWNLGIGAINRQMRGLPDDFKGDQIEREVRQKTNTTIGAGANTTIELLGADKNKGKGQQTGSNSTSGAGGASGSGSGGGGSSGGGTGGSSGSGTGSGTSLGLSLNLSLDLMYNSYKGFGISIDPGIQFNMGFSGQNGPGFGIGAGFGMSFNSFEGASVNASTSAAVSYTKGDNKVASKVSLQTSRNGKLGNKLGLTASASASKLTLKDNGKWSWSDISGSTGFDLSYNVPAYTPQLSIPFDGANVSVNVGIGPAVKAAFGDVGVRGFFSTRYISKNKTKGKAYGAMYLEHAYDDPKSLMDFNREKDGPIRADQAFLPIPSMTSDALSVTGQAIAGTYQLYRNDIPVFFDNTIKNISAGGNLGVEAGAGDILHAGADLNLNYATDASLRPTIDLGNIGSHSASKLPTGIAPYYYKAVGELTAEEATNDFYLENDKVIRMSMRKWNFTDLQLNAINLDATSSAGEIGNALSDVKGRSHRKPRSKSIQPYTNALIQEGNTVTLPEFAVKYYELGNTQPSTINQYNPANRTLAPSRTNKDHIGGYTVVGQEGNRWNYGLPAKNLTQKEATFSIKDNTLNSPCERTIDVPDRNNGKEIKYKHAGTDNFLDIRETPSYAHAYLLTSIIGTDYIDTDPTDGEPNEKDKGYWVRFEYVRTAKDYKWRSPFIGANYNQGLANKDEDDKGSFAYGERENFQLARIITKTHVATFSYSTREDGRGAADWLQDQALINANSYNAVLGARSYKLDQINIYSKLALEKPTPIPLKTVHLNYDYSLCRNVENNGGTPTGVNANRGKLTLKGMHFTYENSNRGALSPYTFEYPDQNPAQNADDYEYHPLGFDRWGTNQRLSTATIEEQCQAYHVTYTDQSKSKAEMAQLAAAWHLSKINLPSGSSINIELERDEYGYEQDRVAGQMFRIKGFGDGDPNNNTIVPDFLYHENIAGLSSNAVDDALTVYFDFEQPVSSQEEFERYFTDLYEDEQGKQLFFSVQTDLFNKQSSLATGFEQTISGYAYIDMDKSGILNTTTGKIVLKPYSDLFPANTESYHPFVLTAWQFIKNYLSDQMFNRNLATSNLGNGKQKVLQLLSMFTSIVGTYKDYYKICSNREYGKYIAPKRSFIRLNTPDRRMYGGGVRVKKVLLKDDWTEENTPVYGMVYDYDMKDPVTDQTISSGVATSTPVIGRESSSLRYAKHYVDEIKGHKDDLYFFEFPLNENFYPGASIGYQQVRVRSLATEALLKKRATGTLPDYYTNNGVPSTLDGFASSGQSIHEFYTCKDFPIITRYSNIWDSKKSSYFPILFVGSTRKNRFTGTQGYSIELNNMHGRPKKVAQYAQDKSGNLIKEPISWVEYHYQHRSEEYIEGNKSRTRLVLENKVDVVTADNPTVISADKQPMEMGVERELFMDVRHTRSRSTSGGININLDVTFAIIPIPLPAIWPNYGHDESNLRTAVTNKVIRRSAIQHKTVAYNGQSIVETENVLYDRYTGQPLLTTVNNNYEDKIYNYNVPAHFAYDRMGPAFKNWGLNFLATIGGNDCATPHWLTTIATNNLSGNIQDQRALHTMLVEGDEFVVKNVDNQRQTKATLIKKKDNPVFVLAVQDQSILAPGSAYELSLVRSGNRNQLTAMVESITAMKDPTSNRTLDAYNCFHTPARSSQSPPPVNVPHAQIKKVLSIGATTYNDSWALTDKDCTSSASDNPFQTGERGIFRLEDTWAYVADRKQSDPVNLKEDGVIDEEVVLFNWDNPFIKYCGAFEHWKRTNTISQYNSDGVELENRNIIGLYSSALYGYKDNLPIAVGSNAHRYELAYEGFETYAPNINFSNMGEFEAGQINIGHKGPACPNDWVIGRRLEIVEPFALTDNEIIIGGQWYNNTATTIAATLHLINQDGLRYAMDINGVVSNLNATTLQLDLGNALQACGTPYTASDLLAGRVTLKETRPELAIAANDLITTEQAHTGTQSLKVSDGSALMSLNMMQLEEGKEYVVSAWIKIPKLKRHSHENEVAIYASSAPAIRPKGALVDGWQRIEGTFVKGTSNDLLLVNTGGKAVYIDDLRIFPFKGNMQSYVYDPTTYKVTATLDNNNYYTRYLYNKEGTLIAVQKETPEGVKTVQETNSYLKSN